LSWNPSSNEKDTIGPHWHDDVNLEVLLGWHAFAYPCTLLGCLSDVLQTTMDDEDPHDVDMELEGNGALHMYDEAPIIAYLQVGEVRIGLTPKGRDRVVHKAKQFKWEGNFLLQMWVNGQVKDVPCPEQLAHFGVNVHIVYSRHSTDGKGCNCKFNNLFLCIWCMIKFGHLSMHLHLTYSPY
jgi:hypothetical protein